MSWKLFFPYFTEVMNDENIKTVSDTMNQLINTSTEISGIAFRNGKDVFNKFLVETKAAFKSSLRIVIAEDLLHPTMSSIPPEYLYPYRWRPSYDDCYSHDGIAHNKCYGPNAYRGPIYPTQWMS
jgi:hypothetical protein